MNTDITIVGGGLSGLLVAYRLAGQGIDFKLIEANSKMGGRIVSIPTGNTETYDPEGPAIDLGPSWFWPDQPHIAALIEELGLSEYIYSQELSAGCSGNAVMEYSDGRIVSGHAGSSMAGSYRLSGGMYHLVHRLLDAIPADAIITQSRVTTVESESTDAVTVVIDKEKNASVASQQVVLALPPRVVAETIVFEPPLSADYTAALLSVPTWMAGHAKFVAVYEEPFWQDRGLSGDGFSQRGPLVEIHNASPNTGGPYALFGFVGVPAIQRENQLAQIKDAAVEQLTRLFGENAGKPVSVHLKDWAFEPLTAVETDQHSPGMHAPGGLGLSTVPGHRIVWAGTETASAYNGYLDGAVEAGERAAELVIKTVQ